MAGTKASNGTVVSKGRTLPSRTVKLIDIPPLKFGEFKLWIIGDRPLLVNNKLNIAESVAEQYGGKGKARTVRKERLSDDERYAFAFYTMPDSKYPAPHPKGSYGIPTSGIKKCGNKAIRMTGITDNTTIGLIGNSFWITADAAGLCKLQFDSLERDVRPVNIGSGTKTVPEMRHRPMFHGWKTLITIKYNPKVLDEEQIINLYMHAGQMVGLCELRAEKRQGECGGFVVEGFHK